ncbi:MAG: 4-demethylwyosine synthase TYW1 [Nitrososphaeria archaeon]
MMEIMSFYPQQLILKLKKQKYQLAGSHSAVKKCSWLHQSLLYNRVCYKEQFFGIKSHRCLQMSPSLFHCNFHCLHCWRIMPEDLGIGWDELTPPKQGWDPPEKVFEESFKAQRKILSGYKSLVLKGKVESSKYAEALTPTQVAISLTGEPTLYPYLGELIELYKRAGCTVFLVTNGTLPNALHSLSSLPTQLYISLTAYDYESFIKLNRPLSKSLWNSILKSLELINSLSCPTVLRITSIKGLNMEKPDAFAKIINKYEPLYVETKAYMHIGYSIYRLKRENMPSHDDIKWFAKQLSENTGYKIIGESKDSRVVLLSKRLNVPKKFN